MYVASDGMGLNNMKPVKQFHKTLSDRINAAKKFISDTNFPGEVVCDLINDNGLHEYDAYPERLLVIQDGVVVLDGGEIDIYGMQFDIAAVISWLKQREVGMTGDVHTVNDDDINMDDSADACDT
jgi:hypothetical protein